MRVYRFAGQVKEAIYITGICLLPNARAFAEYFLSDTGKQIFTERHIRHISIFGNDHVYREQDTQHRQTLGERQRSAKWSVAIYN
jgi:hypothetical protein